MPPITNATNNPIETNPKSIFDIHERIYLLVLRILKLIRITPKTPENLVIIQQLSRSITSMGANDQEADGTDTRRDFIHTYVIVRKESKETKYWIRLIGDLNTGLKIETDELICEIQEIVNIVSAIIRKSSIKLK
jgi:four helix bundle protein